jgi:hypothetical protein
MNVVYICSPVSSLDMIELLYLYQIAEIFCDCSIFAKFCNRKRYCLPCLFIAAWAIVQLFSGDKFGNSDLLTVSSESSFMCHTCCYPGPLYTMSHPMVRSSCPTDSNPRLKDLLYSSKHSSRRQLRNICWISNIKIF